MGHGLGFGAAVGAHGTDGGDAVGAHDGRGGVDRLGYRHVLVPRTLGSRVAMCS